jgi:hypothetical protein
MVEDEDNYYRSGLSPETQLDQATGNGSRSNESNRTGDKKNGQNPSMERQVLSEMCDNIHSNQSCLNSRIRRMFSLEDVLMSPRNPGFFLEKRVMMDQLSEYDNLIKAIGALSFVQ